MPRLTLLMLLTSLLMTTPQAPGQDEPPIRITVLETVTNPVDARLFGHFMERASWGEPGYDAARAEDNPNQLRPDVVEKMQWMNIPIIRFPAGSDLRKIDWRDMIDNVPGRAGGRPLFAENKGRTYTNAFGIDEFLALCENLDAEPMLPVRFYPALYKNQPLDEAAREAAALVAYCNAEVGADLPEGMADWPAVRARNGRTKPWGVKYIQIGNETWHYYHHAMKKLGLDKADPNEQADWYIQARRAFLEAIHAVDPDVQIIVDGVASGHPWTDRTILNDDALKKHAAYVALHMYQPWGMSWIERGGERVAIDQPSAKDLWYAYTTVPATNRQTGQVRLPYWPDWWLVQDLGLPVAVTEWNWNGWWKLGDDKPDPKLRSPFAQGVGAAGMLHAMMRRGDQFKIACQSMLVGARWGITSIRLDDDGDDPPRYTPTGLMTGFYSRHHGRERLATEINNMVTYDQPYRINALAPAPRVAAVDIVVTRSDRALYLHLINRHFDRDLPIEVDLTRLGIDTANATHRHLTADLEQRDDGTWRDADQPAIQSARLDINRGRLTARLPQRSVSIIEIPSPTP